MILEENNPDDLEYKKQLGLVGLELVTLSEMVDDQRGDASRVSSFRRYGGQNSRRSLVDYQTYDSEDDDNISSMYQDDRIVNSLVEQLRTTTIKVKLLNAMSDLIYPLSERINSVALEIDAKNNIRQHETSMYLDRLLKAIDGLNGRQDANRGFYLAAKEFFRNPFLSIGRGISQLITAGIKFGLGTLFGFGDKKTDTDRIVDAINRQTEWHMTNQIDQSKGFFQRLKEQGVLGMAVRGVSNIALGAGGVSRSRAQEIEDLRSKGIDPNNKQQLDAYLRSQGIDPAQYKGAGSGGLFGRLRDVASSKIYGDEIVKKGRLGSANEQVETPVHDAKMYELLSGLVSDLSKLFAINQSRGADEKEVNGSRIDPDCRCSGMVVDGIGRLQEAQRAVENSSTSEGSKLLTELFNKEISEVSNLRDDMYAQTVVTRDTEELKRYVDDVRYEDEQLYRRKEEKSGRELYDLLAESRDGVFEVVKYTKQTVKEARTSRAQAFLGTLSNLSGKILNAISIVGAGIASAAGSIIAAIWASSRARGGSNLPVPVGGDGNGRSRSGGVKAGVIGLAAAGGLALAGTQAEPGSKLDAGIDTAGYAATGAGFGSMIGGVKGAGVGAAIGGLYGLYQNWDNLFIRQEEENKSWTEKIKEFGYDTWESVKEKTNSLVTETQTKLQAERESLELKYPEAMNVANSAAANLVEISRDAVSSVREKAADVQLPSIVEKLSGEVTDFVSGNITPLVSTAGDRLTDVIKDSSAEETGQKIVDFTREVKRSTLDLGDSITEQVSAIQERVSLSLDSMRDVFDSLKSQASKTIDVLNEHASISKEIAASLKVIASNTKQTPQPEGSPFGDSTDDGFLKMLFGR